MGRRREDTYLHTKIDKKNKYMRRIITLLAMFFVVQGAMAQNPRAVLKCIIEEDLYKATEKFQKISDKTISKMPEMYYLAKAALLCMEEQPGESKIEGYEILAQYIDDIRSSENIDKVFGRLDTTLNGVIIYIEQSSYEYIIALDDEMHYVHYLELARVANHSSIDDIENRLEYRRYRNAMESEKVEDCNYFLNLHPASEYLDDVIRHRTDLLYAEAMATDDESTMEAFVSEYPTYVNVANVAERLMNARHKRIFGGTDIDAMKWFIATYPERNDVDALKQSIANLEFPTIEHTVAALEAFIAYYPNATQIEEARVLLTKVMVLEQGSVKDFVAYVKSHGYDDFYHSMIHAIYEHSGRYIITPDLSDVTLIQFADKKGYAGYMDLEGNTVIAPIYSCERPTLGNSIYDVSMLSEFTTYSPVAFTSIDGLWGAINSSDEIVIDFKYDAIALIDSEILCIKDMEHLVVNIDPAEEEAEESVEESAEVVAEEVTEEEIIAAEDGAEEVVDAVDEFDPEAVADELAAQLEQAMYDDMYKTYFCDIYDLKGNLIAENDPRTLSFNSYPVYRQFIDNSGEMKDGYITRNYAISRDDNGDIKLVNRDGEERIITWSTAEAVTDDMVVIELNDGNLNGRYFVDLKRYRAIKECPYSCVYPMSNGRAMVFDGVKYGFIDEDLNLVIDCIYDFSEAISFSCGLFVALDLENDGYKLINTKGETVVSGVDHIVDVHYDNGRAYNTPGLFLVCKGTRYTLIDATGTPLVEIEDSYMPRVEGNYLVDSNNTKHLFSLTTQANGETEAEEGSANVAEESTDEDVLVLAEQMPKFLGGDVNKFQSWVLSEVKYPESALESGIQGNVLVKFIIEKDGSLSNIEVIQSPDEALSAAVVEVLCDSPKWEPALNRGELVRVTYTLPVSFKLE